MAIQLAPAYCSINPLLCAKIGTTLVRGVIATAGFLTGLLLSKKIEDTAESYSETREVSSTVEPCPSGSPPPKKDCNTAKKLLKEYKRLSSKGPKKGLSKKEIEHLDRLRKSGDITSYDLPGTLQRIFPGTLQGKKLRDIITLCGKK